MNCNNQATFEKMYWKDVSQVVTSLNPTLGNIINEIDPGNDCPIYIARYPYGSIIVKNGVFHIPDEFGHIVPIHDKSIDSSIQTDLTYRGIGLPAGLVLKHTLHEAVATSRELLPLGVVKPGSIFALWKKLDNSIPYHPINMFTITSGARFIFMIPNISNLVNHNSLKKDFNLRLPPPNNLTEHWHLFKAILNADCVQHNWSTEVLFFSKSWFDKIYNDEWPKLHVYFLRHAWDKSAFDRNIILYRLAFSQVISRRNLKPDPYLADTANHLFMLGSGVYPGFAPATDDTCAPNALLRKAYLESYGLKYNPTIFLPVHFDYNDEKPIYYSLQLPTTLEFSPKKRKISSTVSKLRELKHVTCNIISEIQRNNLNIQKTVISKIAEEVNFEFFHSKPDNYDEVRLSNLMAHEDENLLYCPEKENLNFSDSGSFVRGCVRVSSKSWRRSKHI